MVGMIKLAISSRSLNQICDFYSSIDRYMIATDFGANRQKLAYRTYILFAGIPQRISSTPPMR